MPRYMSVSIIIFLYYLIVLRCESIFVLYFEIKQLTSINNRS
nr:MAG TPA: CCSMST1 family protein [Caudoviricetes sp.]